MNSCIRRLAAISVIFLFGAAASAGGPAATLSSSGPVWTNSTALPSGGAVHAGDRIRTGDEGLAVITSRAGRVEIRPGSVVTWKGDGVVLESGSAASDGGAIRLSEITVRPETAAEAWFVVARNGGRPHVAAYRGNVTIVAPGVAPLLVPAGSYAVAGGDQGTGDLTKKDPDAGARTDKKTKKNKKDKKRPAGAGRGAAAAGGVAGKAAGGWTIGSLSHAASIALAAGVGAAATGATIAAVTLTEPSPSPSE